MKRILVLSGGGTMGMAQVQVLAKLEEEYGKPLHEVYDLIAGTSVGAINASIVASGIMSMRKLADNYESYMSRVFKKRGFFKKPKYDTNNFYNLWDDIAPEGIKMGDVKTRLMITSVDLVDDVNIFFKSWHEKSSKTELKYIVARSFAAPMYFGQIVDKEDKRVYSDGGIGNSNFPINEVKLQAEVEGWYHNGEEVQIDAIGTLYPEEKQSFDKVAKGRWTKQLLEFMNPAKGGMARVQSREDQIRRMKFICEHNPSIKFRYWDHPAKGKTLKLDGVDHVNYYKELGLKMAEKPLLSFN